MHASVRAVLHCLNLQMKHGRKSIFWNTICSVHSSVDWSSLGSFSAICRVILVLGSSFSCDNAASTYNRVLRS